MNKSTTVMVNFSGGVDSTLVLVDLLEANKNNENINIIAHHVVLKNHLNRWQRESESVKDILSILFDRYKNFKYAETTIDVTGHVIIYDSLYTTQAAAAYCFRNNISKVYVGFIKEDKKPNFDYQQVLSAPFIGESPKITIPLRNTSKREVIRRLKEYPDLFRLCFWCRTPRNNIACGRCSSCRLNKKSQ